MTTDIPTLKQKGVPQITPTPLGRCGDRRVIQYLTSFEKHRSKHTNTTLVRRFTGNNYRRAFLPYTGDERPAGEIPETTLQSGTLGRQRAPGRRVEEVLGRVPKAAARRTAAAAAAMRRRAPTPTCSPPTPRRRRSAVHSVLVRSRDAQWIKFRARLRVSNSLAAFPAKKRDVRVRFPLWRP